MKEAEEMLEAAAKFNKRSLPKGILEQPDAGTSTTAAEGQTEDKPGGFLAYMKRSRPRRYMLVMMFLL